MTGKKIDRRVGIWINRQRLFGLLEFKVGSVGLGSSNGCSSRKAGRHTLTVSKSGAYIVLVQAQRQVPLDTFIFCK